MGLLCTALAEHRANINAKLHVRAWPAFKFNLEFVPIQTLKRHLDFIATEAHFQFLQANRTALQQLDSFDKACYHAALQSVPHEQRQGLLAAQTLGLWSDD